MIDTQLNCDCLVIGSGPGGATTALVLAEAHRDVIVLEEGPEEQNFPEAYSLSEMNKLYRYGGVCVSWGNPKIAYLEGRCLGGASEINGALYHRLLPEALDVWKEKFRIKDFSLEGLEPYYKINEQILNIRSMSNGLGAGAGIIEEGAKKLGWKVIEVPRMWEAASSNIQGQRRSMSRSFIPMARSAGARFISQLKVKKLILRQDKAVEAICVSTDGKNTITRVGFNHVFVCGGAIQTPLLLRRSGMTTNIGEQLKMHLSVKVVARFDRTASAPDEGVPVMQVAEFKPNLTLGGAYGGQPFLALWLAGRKDFSQLIKDPSRMGIFHASIPIKGKGRVRGNLINADAIVSTHLEEDDFQSLGEGLYKLGQVLFASGAQIIYSPIMGGSDYKSLDDMESLRSGLPKKGVDLSTLHLFSSCPMGENMKLCAVDSFGRVHGKKNIYVNDASILPDSPGGNPQAVIMALARRNAVEWLRTKGM